MKEKGKKALRAVWQDLKNIKWALLVLAVYYVITYIFFREFCLMRIISGLPCPGCGATRAGVLLLSFRWQEAFEMNPTIFLWVPYIVYLLWNRYFGKERKKLSNILLVAVCIVVILWYVRGMFLYFPVREPYTYFEGNLLQRSYPFLFEMMQRR